MEPATIVGLVQASISLAVQCGSVAKSLNNLAGQYRYAKLTISTMVQNLEIMQLAWDRIGAWSKDYVPIGNYDFTQRLERFLETGSLVLGALEEDLRSYDVSNMSFRRRSRLVWNEGILQGHQSRIRDQAQSMSLLLQAIQLPTPKATTDLLAQSKKQFMKSDESAFSIVPSRLSSRISLSTDGTDVSDSTESSASIVYHRLSFEDDLFTTRVYKRNYRSPQLHQPSKWKSRNELSTVTSPNESRQYNNEIAKLKFQRFAEGITTTTISSEIARFDAEEDTEDLTSNVIMVTSNLSVSTEEIDPKLEDRVGKSSLGWDGLYVRLVQNLEHRIRSSVPDSYVKFVKTCGRGDNDLVKRQLAEIPVITSKDPATPGLLGRYFSGSFYFCPIHASVSNGHVEVMRTLLQRAKEEKEIDWVVEKVIGGARHDSWRPLHVAAMKGNLQMVQLLLENGAFVNSKTGLGIQAIHLAAGFGSVEILQALIDAGADVGCTDLEGRQPLHYVSQSQVWHPVILYLAMREAIATESHPSDEPTALQLAHHKLFTAKIEALSLAGQLVPFVENKLRSISFEWIYTRRGSDRKKSPSDGIVTLHALFLEFFSVVSLELSEVTKMLGPFLNDIDLLAKDTEGETVVDSVFDLWVENGQPTTIDLELLFLGCLLEDKFIETRLNRR